MHSACKHRLSPDLAHCADCGAVLPEGWSYLVRSTPDAPNLGEFAETWIFCGRCEDVLDYIPSENWRITTDGLMMIQEAGWKYNGIHWECATCLAALEVSDA